MQAGTVVIGHRLGLYRAMAGTYHDRSIDWARKAAADAGVSDRVRRAAETPFNLVYEARS
jgi:hypothetical protein